MNFRFVLPGFTNIDNNERTRINELGSGRGQSSSEDNHYLEDRGVNSSRSVSSSQAGYGINEGKAKIGCK